MRIFLTGGTGLIGSHVADQLRARGDEVIALVRSTSDCAHLMGLGCHLVEGDVLGPDARLAAAMAGCDVVIHAAARVFERAGRKEFVQSNVEGTEAVLRAAARAVPRVIHLSSVAVYSGVGTDFPLTEDRWLEADPDRQNAYAASKHLSERAAWHLHEEGAIRLTTIRPSVVYGERDRAAAPLMMRLARLPLVPLPGGGRALLPLVYAGNVARGVVAAVDRASTVGRAYNLALDHPVTLRELVGRINEAAGRHTRTVTVPAAPLTALARGAEWVGRLLPGSPGAGVARAVHSLVRDNPYDSSRARRELDWTDLITHQEGVRRTARWWHQRSKTE